MTKIHVFYQNKRVAKSICACLTQSFTVMGCLVKHEGHASESGRRPGWNGLTGFEVGTGP
jgi:NO-binding membrane sensor protein with MHYT domain